MKELSHQTTSNSAILIRATVALLLFSAGYSLGFLSAASPHLLVHFPSQPSLKSTAASPQPPSSSSPPDLLRFASNCAPPLPSQPSLKSTAASPQPPASSSPPDLLRFASNCAPPLPSQFILPTLLKNLFNSTSPYAGFPSPYTAAHLLPPSPRPRGWGSTNPVFLDLISTVRPTTIIELGTFLGASALHMAALTRNLSMPETLILCIDDFRGWPGFQTRFRRHVPPPTHGDSLLLHQFMLGAVAAGESHRLLPVPFSTSSALQALCEWGVYGDLVEVDAGHDFHSAWADINRAWKIVRPGGVLFGHDYHTMADDRGVRRAVTLFAKVNGVTVRPHGQHWVLSPKPEEELKS